MKVKSLLEKLENLMIGVTFAEAGMSEEAIKYAKTEKPTYTISPALKGVNIWFGVALIED